MGSPRHPDDIKERALRLSREDVSDKNVGEALGISHWTVRGWREAEGIEHRAGPKAKHANAAEVRDVLAAVKTFDEGVSVEDFCRRTRQVCVETDPRTGSVIGQRGRW